MLRGGHRDPDVLCFFPFRLDLSSEQLWRDEQVLALRPKTFAVLRYLVEHSGKLVTKDDLLDTVWAGTVVSDTVLKSCIRELREALGDDVHRHSTLPPCIDGAIALLRHSALSQVKLRHLER
jgi:DNA-binding winged helix-turn-helix (wHTH) protein